MTFLAEESRIIVLADILACYPASEVADPALRRQMYYRHFVKLVDDREDEKAFTRDKFRREIFGSHRKERPFARDSDSLCGS